VELYYNYKKKRLAVFGAVFLFRNHIAEFLFFERGLLLYIHIIACQVFLRELCYCASQSENTITFTWLPQGLHDTPEVLRQSISEAIDGLNLQCGRKMRRYPPDAVALCYGLCSNGVVGLTGGEVPLVVPKTDDCIALFLGSQKRYRQLFDGHGGTFWLTDGWVENAFIPSARMLKDQYESYVRQFGKEDADYLQEVLTAWIKSYDRCAYISSSVRQSAASEREALEIAALHNWRFERFDGDMRLIRRLVDGDWNEEFLICPPGHRIAASYDENKITAVPDDPGL